MHNFSRVHPCLCNCTGRRRRFCFIATESTAIGFEVCIYLNAQTTKDLRDDIFCKYRSRRPVGMNRQRIGLIRFNIASDILQNRVLCESQFESSWKSHKKATKIPTSTNNGRWRLHASYQYLHLRVVGQCDLFISATEMMSLQRTTLWSSWRVTRVIPMPVATTGQSPVDQICKRQGLRSGWATAGCLYRPLHHGACDARGGMQM